MEADVVVVGSGAAALAAAVTAAAGGAEVAVFEKEPLFGGTTCFSGGGLWIPNNRFMKEAGIPDSREAAIEYVARLVNHAGLRPLIERYVDECNPMLDFLERETKVRFEGAVGHPDYRMEVPGSLPHGRGVAQGPFDTNGLGDLNGALRRGWTTSGLTSNESYAARHGDRIKFDLPRIREEREQAGFVGMGVALVGFLLEACLAKGVGLHRNSPVLELLRPGERVSGVVVDRDGSRETVRARLGVVLACGGFEWNPSLVDRFLGVPMVAPASPGHNVGDGLSMAMRAGAGLGTMTEAWWNMLYANPGDEYEGHQLYRTTSDVRGLPGMICVNRRGRRFVNEALNYHDLGKSMFEFDPVAYEYPNSPAFMIFDAEFRATYPIAWVAPEQETPGWLQCGATLAELAELAGIDPAGLQAQVEEFNRDAASLVDPSFHRGETAYDNHMGEPSRSGPAANLRPLGGGPYYAVKTYLGCFGTKGGPLTDPDARVLDTYDQPIPGLYAAGNTAAHVFGAAYPGPGATLGPALTFGYLAGRHLTRGLRG